MFRALYPLVAPRARTFDVLIALGTHAPLTAAEIYRRVGITAEQHREEFPRARFFNHAWQDPAQLARIGTIGADELAALSSGLMRRDVEITVNRMALEADLVMIVGPTFPHEVVGFSGGNKYLFPGISGQPIIDAFHWLGALIGSAAVIGAADTPVRAVVDRAASMLPTARLCMSLVVAEGGLAGLWIGAPEAAWREAAALSARLHVVRVARPFRRVLSCVPPMYPELWTGAKAMYKLEPVVADGGELIIYAPHVREVSVVHGATIERIGYHVRDYFLAQMERFADVPGGVLAHSTHVKGMGTYEAGVERPRIAVTLATGIPRATCERINLGYCDPASIDPNAWRGREDDGILVVPRAGEQLYRLVDDPFQRRAG
jgi:nickel-dependent lactate racemase